MKTSKYLSICAILAAGAMVGACSEDFETVDNIVYVDGTTEVTTLFLNGEVDATSYTLQAHVPQPAAGELTITYVADATLVDAYNKTYGMDAIMLPAENYAIPEPTATIGVGGVNASPVKVEIKGLDTLDDELVYCLPVTVKASIPVMGNKSTRYFLFRGASLINWVANLNENYLQLASPGNASQLNGIQKLTVEALIRPGADFGEGNEAGISTLLGIEGDLLLRFGDAGVPTNQLQFACSQNVSNSQWTVENEKWQFITFTYDATNGQCQFFIDGIQKGETMTSTNRKAVNWGSSNFYVGKSYSNARDFGGDIAELRVWNRILSPDELKEKNHFYKVSEDAEGLVSYWKMNEGGGDKIHDFSNGYDLIANSAIDWVPVSLPK